MKMKQMTSKMRVLCAILCAVLLLPMLLSCGARKVGGRMEKVKLEHVYKTQYIDVAVEERDSSLYNCVSRDGLLYFETSSYDSETQCSTNYFYSLQPETGEVTQLLALEQIYEQHEETAEYRSIYYSTITPGAEGTFWAIRTTYYENASDPENYIWENTQELIRLAADGTAVQTIPLHDLAPEVENIYGLVYGVGGEDRLFLSGGNMACVVNGDGTLVSTITFEEDTYTENPVVLGDGTVLLCYENHNASSMIYSCVTGRLSEDMKTFVPLEFEGAEDVYSLMPGEGDTFYYRRGDSIYSYCLGTGETAEELNFLNSDINSSNVGMICPLSEGRFFMEEYNNAAMEEGQQEFLYSILTKVSDEDAVEKYMLTLAAVWLNDSLRNAIIQFNRQSDEYRIQYKDYSQFNTDEDYDAGTKQLNNDILNGDLPDLICMEGLSYDTYASKGLLADLGKRMEADPEFNRSDYWENILDANRYHGKLYSVIPNFTVVTMAAKTENVGEGDTFTMADLQALRAKFPEASVFGPTMPRSAGMNFMCQMALKHFVDDETGTCHFDSPDFCALLELLREMPESFDYEHVDEGFWEEQENAYRENRTLLAEVYMSNYSRYNIADKYETFGGDIRYVGFPVPSGQGSVIIPDMEVAVSAKTAFGDVCWDFVKYLMSPDYQSRFTYGFSIRRDQCAKMAQEALKEQEQFIVYNEMYSDIDYFPYPGEDQMEMTQEMIDKVDALLGSVSTVSRYIDYQEMYQVIEENAGAFFAGQKSVQDVCAAIQSSIQLLLNETR